MSLGGQAYRPSDAGEEGFANAELNDQLRELTKEKQELQDQIAAYQQDEAKQEIQASRQAGIGEWLACQPMCFTVYDDIITRRFIERITVVDTDTIC